MESMREVDRVMEREIAKGSCPLKLERIEIDTEAYQSISSQEKLHEVLSYLLRVGDYRQYAVRTVNNNVYMDIKGRELVFHRTKSVIERNNIYKTIRRHEKKLQLDYLRGICLETAKCIVSVPEKDLDKYQYANQQENTFAFVMSDKYIKGLYAYCLMMRKGISGSEEQGIVALENVKDVLFQCLLMDDVQTEKDGFSMKLYSVYIMDREIEKDTVKTDGFSLAVP